MTTASYGFNQDSAVSSSVGCQHCPSVGISGTVDFSVEVYNSGNVPTVAKSNPCVCSVDDLIKGGCKCGGI